MCVFINHGSDHAAKPRGWEICIDGPFNISYRESTGIFCCFRTDDPKKK
jgi:hypothetical protein